MVTGWSRGVDVKPARSRWHGKSPTLAEEVLGQRWLRWRLVGIAVEEALVSGVAAVDGGRRRRGVAWACVGVVAVMRCW